MKKEVRRFFWFWGARPQKWCNGSGETDLLKPASTLF
jgi:hypothetical protein